MTCDSPSVKPKYPIRDIFQEFYPDYFKHDSVTGEQSKAAWCISNCKTGHLGYNVSYCEECGQISINACSCNNRNCPNCQSAQEQKWILARNSELIEGIAYYHAVFTVPFELNDLIYANQKALYNLMFRCISETLLDLCKDSRHMGATPGGVMVLHTWGQKLNFHPHIHIMLSGGGLNGIDRFVETSHKGFCIPVKAMGKLFRGKFLDSLKKMFEKGELTIPSSLSTLEQRVFRKKYIDKLYEMDWIPFIKETFNGNGNAVKYLARYAYRTAISNSRIISVTEENVTISYKDYADGGCLKELVMTGQEFLHRFLQHVLPKGFNRIRFFGFLSNCIKTKRLKLIHKLRNTIYQGNPTIGMSISDLMMTVYQNDICSCPDCHVKMLRLPRGYPLRIRIAE
jgi:hypothetical protein